MSSRLSEPRCHRQKPPLQTRLKPWIALGRHPLSTPFPGSTPHRRLGSVVFGVLRPLAATPRVTLSIVIAGVAAATINTDPGWGSRRMQTLPVNADHMAAAVFLMLTSLVAATSTRVRPSSRRSRSV
jgi:hypothetical protein